MSLPRPYLIPLAAFGALSLATLVLAGCSPEPDPTPTPTAAFASEEEAFAAAEETYRAYNDALNASRQDSPTLRPDDFLIGTALEGFIDGREFLRAKGLKLQGPTAFTRFVGEDSRITTSSAEVTATVCLDVSGARIIDDLGNDVTPPARDPLIAQRIKMLYAEGSFHVSQESDGEVALCSLD